MSGALEIDESTILIKEYIESCLVLPNCCITLLPGDGVESVAGVQLVIEAKVCSFPIFHGGIFLLI